jgi:uroporphyrinogen decarboxylase
MQTSRELIQALLRNGNPERVGLMEQPWEDTIAAWIDQGYPTRQRVLQPGQKRWRREDGRRVDVEMAGVYEEPVPAWRHFGFDLAATGGWFDILPLVGCEELVAETDTWEIKRNGAGAALKYWKHKSGTPEHIDFRMTSREIWERDYRPHLIAWDEARLTDLQDQRENMAEAVQAARWVHFGHQFIWETMRQSMGDVTLYTGLLDDPGWIHDFGRVYTDLYKQAFLRLMALVGKPDGIWLYEDLGYKNGLFASPKLLAQLIFPYYSELVAFFHDLDLPVVLHSCGSVAQALPLIVEAGFDGLNPMEHKARDNDPFRFAEQYGDRLAFFGGLDARVFETNDRMLIRKEMVAYLEGMKRRGARLIFASDHSLSPLVRYDTYCYAVEVYREHMRY